MIVFDLECRSGGHRFEGWFGSSEQFASQQARGLVTCPICNSGDVHVELAKGIVNPGATRPIAAWILHLRGKGPVPVNDFRADEVKALVAPDEDTTVRNVLTWLGIDNDDVVAVVLRQMGEILG